MGKSERYRLHSRCIFSLRPAGSPQLFDNLYVPEVHVGSCGRVDHLQHCIHREGCQLAGVLGNNLEGERGGEGRGGEGRGGEGRGGEGRGGEGRGEGSQCGL